MIDLLDLLRLTKELSASDLHLLAGSPPILRIHGVLEPVENISPLAMEDLEQMFHQISSEAGREEFQKNMELDIAYSLPDVGRFRCNIARQKGTISMVIRRLSLTIPTLEDLSLPDVCKELVLKPRGLVVISGPTGSGKSTTLAAMINYLNYARSRRVVTIEDPVEYLYGNNRCVITQRELGGDTHSFSEALRHVLRQDPDVILVGEMRDLDTAATVLTTAETGHLVLTTGHAPSSPQAVERIIDMFPPHERALAQSRLASLLLGILCQTLVPKRDGTGRVAAVEVMLANSAVKNLIREGKIHQIPNIMRTQTQLGMEMLDQCLVRLYNKGAINYDDLIAVCNDRDEITRLLGNSVTVATPG